jgi:hypothetical protein
MNIEFWWQLVGWSHLWYPDLERSLLLMWMSQKCYKNIPNWLKWFEMVFCGRCLWVQRWTFGSITAFSPAEITQLRWDRLWPITSSHHVHFNYYWNSPKPLKSFSLDISIFIVKRLNRLRGEALWQHFKIFPLYVTEYHIQILGFTDND